MIETSSYTLSCLCDTKKWSRFVLEHPNGNIFHSPEIYDVFSATYNMQPKPLFVLDENHELISMFLPVLINTKKTNPVTFFTQRGISYGSILSKSTDTNHAAVTFLLNGYKKSHRFLPIYSELRNIYDVSYLREIIIKNGFCYYDYLNYLIPLELPVENMLRRISRSTRKKLRKHVENPVLDIISVTDREQIEICYDILKTSYRRNCVPLADKSLFFKAFDILSPKNMVKFTLAKYQNQYIATSIDLLYKNTIYGWYGGFNRKYSKLLPNEIIMWHLLDWGAQKKFQWYDFGGAGRPEEKYGVRDFKAKFGGNLVNYGRFLYIHSPIRYHLGAFAYKITRKLMIFCKSWK